MSSQEVCEAELEFNSPRREALDSGFSTAFNIWREYQEIRRQE